MGKFPFPSCRCSCSCFSPSSPPQEETLAGPSTPSSSSQPCQQPANAGRSTAINTDLESFLQKFNDLSQLHNLIQFIEELLKIASGEQSDGGSSSEVGSYIQDGQTILEFVDKHIDKPPEKKYSMDGASQEIEKVVIDLLKGAGKIHWVGAALSVVAFVLAGFSQMSNYESEFLEILKDMFALGKQILQLNDQMPDQKQQLNVAVQCIIVGCTMCASQLATAKLFRFLRASLDADSLNNFRIKIDRLYCNVQLYGAIEILASHSEFLFKPTAGIESARDEVIRLLDLNAQHTSPQVVVVYGLGGVGKTTLADAVYAKIIDLQSYKLCRIHMHQKCTKNELKVLQEQILKELFQRKVKLTDCNEGRGVILSLSKTNRIQPLFLYIDNALKITDLKQLLPEDLGSWLPLKSRILVTTRNLPTTDIFVDSNIARHGYRVVPLPETEAREILLTKASDYNDERKIDALLNLCGGVPLLLEIAGSQLAISTKNENNIVSELISEGETVEGEDRTDRIIDFVYRNLSESVQEAFLDITSFFYGWSSKAVACILGEEEFKALEEASLVKTSESGSIVIHDIVQARGKKMSKRNRIRDPQTLLDYLADEENVKNIKGIFFEEKYEQPEQPPQHPIKINDDHLKCMSSSLRVLSYGGLQITFGEKCHEPFKQLRCLRILSNISDLPMEFEKLEHLTYYTGPFMQGMSLYELPPSLRAMHITGSSENVVADSEIPHKATPASSLVKLGFSDLENMQRLPDGVEKLTKLKLLHLIHCPKLEGLPSDFVQLNNLKMLQLRQCNELKELSSDFGQLNNLKELQLYECYKLEELPSNFGQLSNLKMLQLRQCNKLKKLPSNFGQLSNLEELQLYQCNGLEELSSDFGQLNNLKKLQLNECSKLKELPSNFGQLSNLTSLDLSYCQELSELPSNFGQLISLNNLQLYHCSKLKKLPSNFGQLKNLEELNLKNCSQLEEWTLNFGDLREMKKFEWEGCSSKLKEWLENYMAHYK